MSARKFTVSFLSEYAPNEDEEYQRINRVVMAVVGAMLRTQRVTIVWDENKGE